MQQLGQGFWPRDMGSGREFGDGVLEDPEQVLKGSDRFLAGG